MTPRPAGLCFASLLALAACSTVVVEGGTGGSHTGSTTSGTGGSGNTTTTTWSGTGGSGNTTTTWSGTGGSGNTTTTWSTTSTTWSTTSTTWSTSTGTTTGTTTWPPPGCDFQGDCGACTSCAWYGPCGAYADACLANPECNAILECYPACPPNDDACYQACWWDHPEGHTDYNKVAICIYCDECFYDCNGPSLGCPG
ncbi:MAG: hypothetical protein HY908_30290 [Myxococcales bacterium]|nr:hypothetical protein [Myxococcales bacterium]